ncbi:flavin reductase family protein, partial [Nocardia vinacea]|uniref:flavin reductase family protein n=1 Tax=Nocardia vinacea TaxID=96468 RepID=UPI000594D77D
ARLLPQDEHGLLPIADLLAEHPDSAIYCCGPEPLLAAVEAEGTRRNSDVHIERFVPRPVACVARGSFEVQLASSGRTFRVGQAQSIVDVLDAAGIEIITSCREGTCGSCETTVLAGDIDHRDSVLTAEERARGDTMMLCVSRAGSDVLVLDL